MKNQQNNEFEFKDQEYDRQTVLEIVEVSKRLQEQGKRGQHPKGIGCVWAEFIVEPNIAPDLRIGIFEQPGKTFPAWIRFSNARGEDDSKAKMHGMAIKLMDVSGEKVLESAKHEQTQDFILIDHPVFFIRDMQDYGSFLKELLTAKVPFKFFFPGFNPTQWRWHEFSVFIAMQTKKKIASLLETPYWSASAYRLGSQAVKFSVQPAASNTTGRAPGNTKDYLREALVTHLTDKPAEFDFLVQVQTDVNEMPTEDSTILWDTQKSPYKKLATIRIPRQTIDTPEQIEFGENLAYNPWHSLPVHAPLGSINYIRKAVYESTSEARHHFHQVTVQEPTPDSFQPHLLDRGATPPDP